MREEFLQRWEREYRISDGRLKKPIDLLRRVVSSDDFIDSAMVGGLMLSDIIAGKIAEHQIPQDILTAFHLQYPNVEFVETVRQHSNAPAAIAGLINGIKGKLFEDRYVAWLNDGHLPGGFHAELAHGANNPAWDIAIKDSHGHVSDLLQAKATASMDYVHEALNAHPDIDVVVTSEVFDSLSQHGDDLTNIIDSHQDLAPLTDQVGDAVSQADAADVAFHVPFIAIGWAVIQNSMRYIGGRTTFAEALRDAGERSTVSLGAAAVGFAVADAVTPGVGIASAFLARLYGRRIVGNFHLRDRIEASAERTGESINRLRGQLGRPVELLLPDSS